MSFSETMWHFRESVRDFRASRRRKGFVNPQNSPKKPNQKRRWPRRLALAFFVCLVVGSLSVIGVFAYFAKDLPSPGKINKRHVIESTKIFDRTGSHLLYEIHGEEKRTIIPFSEMPESIKAATLSLEDQDFYTHKGIKFTSIIRATLTDLKGRKAKQGGSTITQQLIKNTVLSREKTFTRKIKEVILSLEVEQKFTKDEILEMYLNEIPYGSNAYGIEAAAQTFFSKPARDLSFDEAALLASLPQAPSYFSPFGSRQEELKARQEMALQKMSELGYITSDQAAEAKEIDVLGKISPYRGSLSAPHFVMYIKEYLENVYGKEIVEEGGLKVYTTLDWEKQQIAERVVREGAEKNMQKFGASNASLVAIDPKTGQILVMVGSKDYFDKSIDGQVNVAIRDRQPGSSFKPYVYLAAMTKGYTPETVLFDVETEFNVGGSKEYKPQNYDGKFRGPVKMKEALGMSLNIPAVKSLYLAGVKESIDIAKRLGITGLNDPDRYGLSLVLGGGEVKLLDHVSAYATMANGGVRNEKTAILRIEDSQGNILEEFSSTQGVRVVEEKHVAMIDHILSTNKYRAPVFGENNILRFDERPVAVKTGTTNEFRDGWTVGYTPSIAVGVWAGNNDNSAMRSGADGSYIAAPIWRSFLDQVLGNYSVEKFPEYDLDGEEYKDLRKKKPVLFGDIDVQRDVRVCEIPDTKNKYCLVSSHCLDDEVKKRDFSNVHNILWFVDKNNPLGDPPKDPEKNDPQFSKWEKGVVKWYEKEKGDVIWGTAPENECRAEDFTQYLPGVSLSAQEVSGQLVLTAEVSAPHKVKGLHFYIDGQEIHSTAEKPYSTSYPLPADKLGKNISVRVDLFDRKDNLARDEKELTASPPVPVLE